MVTKDQLRQIFHTMDGNLAQRFARDANRQELLGNLLE